MGDGGHFCDTRIDVTLWLAPHVAEWRNTTHFACATTAVPCHIHSWMLRHIKGACTCTHAACTGTLAITRTVYGMYLRRHEDQPDLDRARD